MAFGRNKLEELAREEQDSMAPTTMPMPAGAKTRDLLAKIDPWIAIAAVVLIGVGTVMVYSASSVRSFSESQAETSAAYLVRHLQSVAFGLALLTLVLRVPLETWSKLAYPMLALTIVLLAALFVPGLGRRVNGAVRWLSLGPASFQPGELAKLAVTVYLAHSLAKKREMVSSFSIGFLPHVLVTSFVVALVIMQPDLGTSAVIYGTLGLMLFIAGTRVSYLALAVAAAMPVLFYYILTKPHALDRITSFMNPEQYRLTTGYQVWESIVSFGSGGAFGVGLGEGQGKLHFLPESHTDFIFAVVGQELGFAGVCLVVGCFAIIAGRGLWIAAKMPCRFPMYLAFGISAWIGLQALVNMAVVQALLPTKGLTLPLVSFGRSSVVISCIAIGILLRASAELQTQSPALFEKRPKKKSAMRRVFA